jgi:hypothetical protein
MKTINDNNFRKLNIEQLNETIGGFFVVIILPDGRRIRVKV